MIIPSIDLMGGQAVQLRQGATLEIEAGDPRPLAEQFSLAGEVAVIDLDAALGKGNNTELIQELLEIAPCRVGGGIRTTEAALEWLDRGAHRVILGTAATREVLEPLPASRVIAALDARDGEVVVEGWQTGTGRGVVERMRELEGLVGGFLVTFVEVEGTLSGLPLDRVAELVQVAGEARVTAAGGIRSLEELARLDRMGVDGQVGMAIYSGEMSLADAVAAPLRSDRPDGLWATVIEDVSGGTLGLAWSDRESLDTAMRERRGVYRSRSRGLWRKGETSGAKQELVRVSVDCDRDALLFTVRQAGSGFCHLGTQSCFDGSRLATRLTLPALERKIRDRIDDPAPGSLTTRLLDDPALLRGKLLEEAEELAEAETPAEAVHEFADLLYFGLTKLVDAGGSVEEVERELARRSLRVQRREPRAPGAPRNADTSEGEPIPVRSLDDVLRRTRASLTDPDTERTVRSILDDVERRGEPAVRHHAERLGDLERGDPWMLEAEALERAADALAPDTRALVERVRDRVEDFARAQLDTVTELDTTVLAGRAGHRLIPVERVGCYAPGGRYPLPSSVLMAVVPARVAGVAEVSVASPNPDPITLAAAHIAGADRLIAVGGAQAIAAMAYGAGDLRACDIVVGPGNRFVAVAKRQVSGRVGIDMTAGPSELLVIASSDASPERIAADLLAQAEHDPDAVPVLCALPGVDVEAVRDALAAQLETLPTREVATASLRQGATLMADGPDDAIRIAEAIAPEHLQTQGAEASSLAERLDRHGALFVNGETPEVVGDYGVGPNHTLPTGGGAAFESGLSPLTFLRRPTWIDLDPDAAGYEDVMRDSAAFARLEGLEAHARSAEARLR